MNIFNTLKQKLVFYLLLCSLLPTIAITFFIIYMGNKAVKKQVSNELYGLAILLEGNINRFLVSGKRISTLLASERYIKKELGLFNKNNKNGLHLKLAQKKLCQYLISRCNLYNGMLSATILNKNGVVVASSNSVYLGEDKSDVSYYKKAKHFVVVSDVYFSEEDTCGAIDFVAPVLSDNKSESLGLLIVKVAKSELDRITTGEILTSHSHTQEGENSPESSFPKGEIHNPFKVTASRRGGGVSISRNAHRSNKSETELHKIIRKGTTRESYLVNKNKLMITASRFVKNTFLKQLVNTEAVIHSLNKQEPFSGIYKDYRGEWVLGFSRFIKDTGWVLLVETDLYEAFHPMKRVRYFALIAFGSSISSMVILSYVATRHIIGHVSLVENAFHNISRGDLNTHLDYRTGDELGKLVASFNEMTLALKRSKDILRNLFDAANDPMFIIERGEMIADMNRRVTEVFGYEKDELVGSNLTSILRTNNIPRVRQAIASTWELSHGQKYPTFDVFVITRNEKEMICELDLNRTVYGIQPHFRDVTETRRMEGILEGKNQELEEALKSLKEVQAQLVHAGKLAGIGELASGVAHEINNPLTAIMGHAMRLLRKAEDEKLSSVKELEPFRTELKVIVDASLRCKRITDGLLKFSRVTPELKHTRINLNAVVDDTLVLVENTLKQKNITLIKQLDFNLKNVIGDPNQLQQVFMNIITNAIHAMPNGGSLVIATREKQNLPQGGYPNPPLLKEESRKMKDGKYMEVEFTDTGCGIKEEHLSKIFDPFFTTKEPGKGTGLGLSISYRIISDHNGWISVKSVVGEGTTFIVALPIANG